MIEVKNLCVSIARSAINSKKASHRLVSDATFSVNQGEILAIIGPNGAGKSTLLKAIVGELAYTGDVSMPRISDNPKLRAKQLAVLHQQTHLNFPFSVEEVVELGRTPHATGKQRDREIVAQAMELMDISYLASRNYTELSGGEKQRTQLARVFCQLWDPDAESTDRLLILDEPLTALDLGHQHHAMKAIRSFASQGIAVMMVLHDINMAARYADQLLALLCSEQIALGSPNQVINEQTMERLFGLPVEILMSDTNKTPFVVGL